MTHRGSTIAKRTLPIGSGNGAAAPSLPLFDTPELEEARRIRAELMHKLAHVSQDVRSRIRTEQKLNLIVAKIIRLEMQLGSRQ